MSNGDFTYCMTMQFPVYLTDELHDMAQMAAMREQKTIEEVVNGLVAELHVHRQVVRHLHRRLKEVSGLPCPCPLCATAAAN